MKLLGGTYLLPDFDKPRRCPAWSGPGFVYRSNPTGCKNGSVWVVPPTEEDRRDADLWDAHVREVWDKPFRFGRCVECGVTTFPYAIRWLNWRWLRWTLIEKPRIYGRNR